MLHKSGMHHLTKNFVKTVLCMAIGLCFFGVGTKVYASQEVENARIINFDCFGRTRTCTLTINRNHPTTSRTASCKSRTFAWNRDDKPNIYRRVREAYDTDTLVGLRYSEYRCYDARREGGDRYMSLINIWLQ